MFALAPIRRRVEVALRLLGRGDELDLLAALGHGDLAHGENLLLGAYCKRAGALSGRLRLRLLARLIGDGNGAHLLGDLQRLPAFDLEPLQLGLALDALGVDGQLLHDARALDAFLQRDLGLLGLQLPRCPLGGELRTLRCTLDLDLALLADAGDLGFPVDLECEFLGFEVLVADGDQRVLLDVVALLLAPLDLFGKPGQALRVEGIRRVEILHVRLIELGQRYRLELQPAACQRRRDPLPHAPGVFAALLVQLLHGHLRRNGAQRVDELALHHVAQAVHVHQAAADRLGRRGHRLFLRLHAHEEVGHHVDAHAVLGDDRAVTGALHLDALGAHADGGDVVEDRHHEGAAVHHDSLSEQTGSHERRFLGRAPVEPVEQEANDDDPDECRDQPSSRAVCECCSHRLLPSVRGPVPRRAYLPRMALNFRVCAVSATSVGSRSMDDAP